jgi:hypothetical protein
VSSAAGQQVGQEHGLLVRDLRARRRRTFDGQM